MATPPSESAFGTIVPPATVTPPPAAAAGAGAGAAAAAAQVPSPQPSPTAASGDAAAATAAAGRHRRATSIVGPGASARIPDAQKVLVHFRPVGNAPILKQNKFKVTAAHSFAVVMAFLRKQLKYKPTDSLFMFCNSAFAPSPEETVFDLFQCFGLSGELVINYCTTDAFG